MDEATPLRLTSLDIENILRIRAARLTFGDGAVVIEGGNEQGKSSVLQSLEMVLAGMNATPDEPIHGNEKKGKIVAQFGDLTVTKQFKRGGRPSLKITSGKQKFSSPQGLLESFLDFVALRPLTFLGYDAAKQLAVLSDLMGLDTTAIDQEEQGTYEDRRDANREVKRLKAAHESLPEHPDAPKAEVKVAELMAELEEVQEHNRKGEGLSFGLSQATHALLGLVAEANRLETQLKATKAKIKEQDEWCAARTAEIDSFEPRNDTSLREKIAKADEVNSALRDNIRKEEARAECVAAEANAEEINTLLETIQKHKAEERKKAAERLPVPGLSLEEDGIYYKDKPLAQAGASAQLRVSVAVAMALNEDKRVKLLLLDNAEKLDPANTKLVVEMAAEKGFQVLLARVGDGKDATVLIEDGTVKEQ